MRTGLAISAVGHVAVLVWSAWSFAAKPLDAKPVESLPVDIISDKDFTKLTAGTKTAKQAETPKPLVEKIAEPKPVDDTTAKVSDKREVVAAREAAPPPPPPMPEARPAPEPKPVEAKPEPKPEPEKVEKKPEPKVDQIAEALKKDAARKPPPRKPPIPVPPKFDPMKIAALLNKEEARRTASAGDRLQHTPSLGVATGMSQTLSQSELDALRARLAQLWNPPAGAKQPEQLIVQIRVQLQPDGTLAAPPVVLTSGHDPLFVAARDSAVRAIFRGQPYDMLRRETYDVWRDIEITFDPRQMFPG